MGAVALYAALLDGKCRTLILKNPPETQNKASQPDGRGEALEMLQCLRVTDVNQIPALLYPTETVCIGSLPDTYQWAQQTLARCGGKSIIMQKDVSSYH
jgi:hypothetical protein